MIRRLNLRVRRYLTGTEFVAELKKLRAYRGTYVGNNLLESLEREGMIKPKVRLRWPDPIARRLWLEKHDTVSSLHESIEPDGVRWEAANSLDQALAVRVIGVNRDTPHPFDDPGPEYTEFLQGTKEQDFVNHLDRRVSVSCDMYPGHYDPGNIRDFYSGWQILAAAEMADMGVHIRTTMADSDVEEVIWSAIREGRLPNGQVRMLSAPIWAMNGFLKHEAALDAIVWSVEEGDAALERILGAHGVADIN